MPTVPGGYLSSGPAASPCAMIPGLQDRRSGQQLASVIFHELRLDWSVCGTVVLLVQFLFVGLIVLP